MITPEEILIVFCLIIAVIGIIVFLFKARVWIIKAKATYEQAEIKSQIVEYPDGKYRVFWYGDGKNLFVIKLEEEEEE